jgi:hypothetical protein
MKPCEEYKRTHSNPSLAFKNHCDYACAIEKHRQSRVWKYLFWAIVVLSVISLGVQVGIKL